MATTILLFNRGNWRNERFPADFTICSLVKNPPDGPKNANTNQNVYASMSEWGLVHDSNRDGVVDMRDFARMGEEWLSTMPWAL